MAPSLQIFSPTVAFCSDLRVFCKTPRSLNLSLLNSAAAKAPRHEFAAPERFTCKNLHLYPWLSGCRLLTKERTWRI